MSDNDKFTEKATLFSIFLYAAEGDRWTGVEVKLMVFNVIDGQAWRLSLWCLM